MFLSFCVSESVCLFVCLAATLLRSLYLLSVFTVIVSFDFVTQPLFSSIITHHFLFHFFIRPLGDIEFERYFLPLAVRCVGKPFKVSTNYFVLFVLQRVTFCFCLLFKLSLATTTGVDTCLCLSFDII